MPINISKSGLSGGRGSVNHRVVACTDSATQVILSTNASYIQVQNIGSSTVYIGGSGVTTNEFWAFMTPRQNYNFGQVDSGFSFYQICSSGQASTLGVDEDA